MDRDRDLDLLPLLFNAERNIYDRIRNEIFVQLSEFFFHSLFEGICIGSKLPMDAHCLRFVQPYLNYIIGMAGNMTAAEAGRFHDIFAKISRIVAEKARELSERQVSLREIEFSVLEKELDGILQDIQSPKRIEHKL